jgi:chromate reductase, NAD(P)H dehydrogenase (quinone)
MRIIAISGSLRAESMNARVLRAAAAVAPPGMEILVYEKIGELPHFNPDLDFEGAHAPPAVAELRALLDGAEGVLISTPEYAHGIPGSLKNALDWLVSTDVLGRKPIVLLNASASGGGYALAALTETLRTMGADVLTQASLLTPFLKKKLVGPDVDPEVAAALGPPLEALATHPSAAAGARGL